MSPYADGELVEDERAPVAAHLHACPTCRAQHQRLASLKTALVEAGRGVEVPDVLEARLRTMLDAERRAEQWRAGRPLLVVVAALAAVVVGGLIFLPRGGASPAAASPPPIVRALAERHALDLPVDVASPNPRRVHDFLAARLGHAPLTIPQLEPHGWGLLGARVVDVAAQRGAQLIYTGGYGQRLSVVVLPDPDGALSAELLSRHPYVAARTPEGLGVRVVARGPSLYSFVSNLDDARLEALTGALER